MSTASSEIDSFKKDADAKLVRVQEDFQKMDLSESEIDPVKEDAKRVEDTFQELDLSELTTVFLTEVTSSSHFASSGDPMLHFAIKKLLVPDLHNNITKSDILALMINKYYHQAELRDKQGRVALEVVLSAQVSIAPKKMVVDMLWEQEICPNPTLSNGKKLTLADYQGMIHPAYFEQAKEKYWTPERRALEKIAAAQRIPETSKREDKDSGQRSSPVNPGSTPSSMFPTAGQAAASASSASSSQASTGLAPMEI